MLQNDELFEEIEFNEKVEDFISTQNILTEHINQTRNQHLTFIRHLETEINIILILILSAIALYAFRNRKLLVK